jgi:phosphotransferase system enzyme I (PtsP)
MDVHARLVAVVSEAASPAVASSSATRVIAEELHADECSIFVRSHDHDLRLQGHFGSEVEGDARDAVRALAGRAIRDALVATSDTSAWALVAAPVISINRTIGAIVGRRPVSEPFSAEEVMRLSGVASQMVDILESVRLVETLDGAIAPSSDAGLETSPSTGERVLRGTAASPGIAIGAATFRQAFPQALVRRETAYRGEAAENGRARDAFQKSRNDLLALQSAVSSELGEEHALIFGAHLLLLQDELLLDLVARRIAAGRSAAIAVDEALDEIVARLRNVSDPYLRERVEDVEDLKSRILGHLVGAGSESAERGAHVIVSSRTSPSLVTELKARGALGIASELGGATSHGALLARALGFPAVSGVEGLTREVLVDDVLVIDGDAGCVVVRPTAETRADYARRIESSERKRTQFLKYRDLPARTADGVRVEILANIGLSADLEVAKENGADGVGLYRTEFLFVVRDGLPTVQEQARVYAKAYDALPGRPIALRVLDLAADKFLPGHEIGVSRDAFHGYRSIRVLFDHPYVLRDQVQAFAIAARGQPLRILIPMVTSVDDVLRVKELVASALAQAPASGARGPLVYGAMVETPAAVEMVTELAREVDFFSIGTNDLIQYTLVVDREDPRMSSERHAYHPAILRMIRRVVDRAHGAGRHVSVCGEMAARPDLAVALVAMGVDALSVTPRVIPELKQAFARVALGPLRASIEGVLAASSLEEVERALRKYVRDSEAPPAADARG